MICADPTKCIQTHTNVNRKAKPRDFQVVRLYGVTLVLLQTGYAATAAANTIQVLSHVLECTFTF